MTRIIKIKSISKKTKSRGKERHKTDKKKKKTGIIEQIKKEQNEKKNNIMYNTFNQRNVNILPIKNETQPPEKVSLAKRFLWRILPNF
jgi:outer membrane biogenesis lipoprotein LolB